jgi:hypothetical protein
LSNVDNNFPALEYQYEYGHEEQFLDITPSGPLGFTIVGQPCVAEEELKLINFRAVASTIDYKEVNGNIETIVTTSLYVEHCQLRKAIFLYRSTYRSHEYRECYLIKFVPIASYILAELLVVAILGAMMYQR